MLNNKLSLNKLINLVDHLNDGVFHIEEDRVVYASQVLLTMLGYQDEDVVGQFFKGFIAEEDRDYVMENYKQRLQGKNIPHEYEFRLLTKEKKKIDVMINVGIYTDEEGT